MLCDKFSLNMNTESRPMALNTGNKVKYSCRVEYLRILGELNIYLLRKISSYEIHIRETYFEILLIH